LRTSSRIASVGFLIVLASAAPRYTSAAITITGYPFGSEGPAIIGATIEDFEDVTLIPGLRIRMGGVPGFPAKDWTGTLPRIWNPATAGVCCLLGGPFPANTWDGTHALCNGGVGGLGNSGVSPGDGNFWDFQFADSVYFVFATGEAMVGVGLSNFQSLSGPSPRTNHELLVNGVSKGLVETLLPGWIPGVNVRDSYMVVTATVPDAIHSITIQNVTNANPDGLVFDKLAVRDFVSPVEKSTWGRIKTIYR